MKSLPLLAVLCLMTFLTNAQVSVRRDITLGKHSKSRTKGISLITLSFGRTRMPTGLYERNTLIIDVAAIRNPGQRYTYRQLAERVYGLTPGVPAGHLNQPMVPYFLLAEPPAIAQRPMPVIRIRR